MIDPLLSLAFSMHSNKGVYALLLGSGVSRSARIPTGWQIVIDLVQKLARLQEESPDPDPAAWYRQRYQHEPDYAEILGELVASPEERSQLLRNYFEPSPTEREEGLKLPTDAHKAVAELVAKGYVRVIVTTNFDRLLEQALEAVGVVPIVVSTPDQAEGALPLAHSRCTVVKVHGDYLDSRIKNTPDELAAYAPVINQLLDQILAEYGLIICGWSAIWDEALRSAIERCESRRFTTYFASYGEPDARAQNLIRHRRGTTIAINGADDFFRGLTEKVEALEEFNRQHPLSVVTGVAAVKKYLVQPSYRIRLYDLIADEIERIQHGVLDDQTLQDIPVSGEAIRGRLVRYETITEVLRGMVATGCYWGEEAHTSLWVTIVERLFHSRSRAIATFWQNVACYPALLLLYVGGVAAVANKNYDAIMAFATSVRLDYTEEERIAYSKLHPSIVLDQRNGRMLPGLRNRHLPLTEHMFNVVEESLKQLNLSKRDFDANFDRFEYLYALMILDRGLSRGQASWAPIGRFAYERGRHRLPPVKEWVQNEVIRLGTVWPPFKSGMFGANQEQLEATMEGLEQIVREHGWP